MDSTRIPECFRLPAVDEVHLWTAVVSECIGAKPVLGKLLSRGEEQVAARFLRPIDRDRYIVAHGILRQLLGRYLACDPAELAFVTGDFGKPELAPRPEQPPISFNMAHSGNVILYALADGSRVGVDVEAIRTDLDVMELAQAQFSPQEVDHLRAISPSEVAEAFYHCWTRKEAYVKARGEGLGFPLKQFSVSFGSNEPFAVQWASDDPLVSERWSMFGVSPAPGYAGAIIVEGRPVRLVSRHWGDSGGRQK